MRRRGAVLVIIVATLSAIFAVRSLKNFLDVDACLDRGGAWDKQASICVGTPTTHDR
jgi:hypothetical protein